MAVPRIHAELAAEGVHIGRKRVARLMRAACLEGVSHPLVTRRSTALPLESENAERSAEPGQLHQPSPNRVCAPSSAPPPAPEGLGKDSLDEATLLRLMEETRGVATGRG